LSIDRELSGTWGVETDHLPEFKEIRKEWKARKKEEDNARKAEEERQRQAQKSQQLDGQGLEAAHVHGQGYQQNSAMPLVTPIGYQAVDGHAQGQFGRQPGGMVYLQQNGQMAAYGNYSNSPYVQQGNVYQQRQW
jgi:transcription factor CON7